MTLDDLLPLVDQLSALDKQRLAAYLAQRDEDVAASPEPRPRESLFGWWANEAVTDEDIDEVRREMWANFPREDI